MRTWAEGSARRRLSLLRACLGVRFRDVPVNSLLQRGQEVEVRGLEGRGRERDKLSNTLRQVNTGCYFARTGATFTPSL